ESAGLLVRERTRAQFTIEEEAEETDEQSRSLAAPRGARWFQLPALIACALLAAAAGYYLWPRRAVPPAPAAPPPSVRSIAVLPFKPLVEASRSEILEMGMADSLIMRLSNLGHLTVRPLTAVRRYTDLDQDAVKAGQELRVEAVLEGNIQRLGDRIRVRVSLVSIADAQPLWAEQFDEKFTDILAVQDSISERVAGALLVKLTGEERDLLKKRYTDNTEAYQLYLKGRYFWNKRTEESLNQAIDYFNQAIDIDPNYALAYAGMAVSYDLLRAFGSLPPMEAMPKTKAAAIKALEIDDTLAEAHTALARIKLNYDWDSSGAERDFKRAIELNPNYPTGHHWYAWYLAAMERHTEAIAEMKRAQELDPLSLVINTDVGWIFYYARQYDQAIAELQKTLEMDPDFVRAHLRLGLSYLQKSMNKEAIETLQKATDISEGSTEIVAFLGYAYAISGNKSEAQKILNDLQEGSRRRYVSPYYIAVIYTGLGEKEQAFKWLEKAYEERSGRLVYLEVEPMFDSLRADPRFTDLLRRVGLAS
ncbi:MAG: tetratricopeptide repeat protein, partial [Acidobacteriota bacterium]|nr:tetratricopeptide repeat protein [Acidobacteriota bacterium]